MDTLKNIGLIVCRGTSIPYQLDKPGQFNGTRLKKIHLRQALPLQLSKDQYPHAEVVQDTQSIINDKTINLVILTMAGDNDTTLISQALDAGKHVQIL